MFQESMCQYSVLLSPSRGPHLDLVVPKEEHGGHPLLSRPPHHPPQVFPPVGHVVVLGHLDLEELKVGHEGGQPGRALPPTAADTWTMRRDKLHIGVKIIILIPIGIISIIIA